MPRFDAVSVSELEETAGTVRFRRYIEEGDSHDENRPAILDLTVLTTRQKEVLEVADDVESLPDPDFWPVPAESGEVTALSELEQVGTHRGAKP